MSAIEVIAVLFAVLVIIKIIVIGIKKEWWLRNIAQPIYNNPAATAVIYVVIAAVILFYLLQSFSIVQIFAVIGFSSILIGLGFLSYGDKIMKLAQDLAKHKINGWEWLYIVFWLVLALWVLWEVLA